MTFIVVSLQSKDVTSDKAEKRDTIDFEPSVNNPRVLRFWVTIEQAKQWNRKSSLLFTYLSRALDLGTDIKLKPRDGRRVTIPLKQLLSVQKIDQD